MKLTASNVAVTNTLSVSRLTIGNNAVVESLAVGNVSINSSAIALGNVSITPAAVSTPSLILGGTSFSGGLFGGIVNYQEFTANGTWNNPLVNAAANASLTGNEQVFVMAWGGGGGASANNSRTCGGGGGACVTGMYTLSALTNTVSVVVGGGGSGITTTTTALSTATSGSNSSFSSLIAYGGAGGSSGGGGGGGGILAIASTTTGGTPLGGTVAAPGGTSTFGGGGGGTGGSGGGGPSIFGGAGGTGTGTQKGGDSIYGGGGGSGVSGGPGLSIFGGNGGESGSNAGKVPGGGGGGQTSPTSVGAGARGEVRVWVIGPGSTTAGAPTYTLTANTTTLYETESVRYTISTTNVANNTTLYYTLNNSSQAVRSDFTTAVNGSVVISGGTGTFILTANNDADSANEAFQIDVRTGSSTGSIVTSNGSVSVAIYNANAIFNGTYSNTSDASSYTFNDVSIGTATADRLVVIPIGWGGGGEQVEVTTATIGGVAATVVVDGQGQGCGASMISAVVPTGTTATVVINLDGSTSRMAIGSYSLYGLLSTTRRDWDSNLGGTNTNYTIPAGGGVAIIGVMSGNTGTFSWESPATSDSDIAVESSYRFTTGRDYTEGSRTTTISNGNTTPDIATGVWR